MDANKSENSQRRSAIWPFVIPIGSLLVAVVAALIWYEAVIVNPLRNDISNLGLAMQSVLEFVLAAALWVLAALLALISSLVSIWHRRARWLAALAIATCLALPAAHLAHAGRPSSEKLVAACRANDLPAISRLLDRGIDVNRTAIIRLGFGYGQSPGNTPLTAAAESGRVEAMALLIDRDADVNLLDGYRVPPLRRAIESHRPACVRLLLEHGATLTHQGAVDVFSGQGGWEALSWVAWAASSGTFPEDDLAVADVVIDFGANLERESLHFNAMWSVPTTDFARRLAARRSEKAAAGAPYGDLLNALALGDDEKALAIMIRDPALLEQRKLASSDTVVGKEQLLILAAKFGNARVVEFLLDDGLSVSSRAPLRYWDEKTPLIEAAAQGHTEVMGILMDHGADPSREGVNGATPLRLAARGGHDDAVQLLIARNARVNEPVGNYTPLFDAAEAGHLKIVKLLVDAGAKVDLTYQHRTPLSLARQNGHQAVVAYLELQPASRTR